jgi:hypothetical protein
MSGLREREKDQARRLELEKVKNNARCLAVEREQRMVYVVKSRL